MAEVVGNNGRQRAAGEGLWHSGRGGVAVVWCGVVLGGGWHGGGGVNVAGWVGVQKRTNDTQPFHAKGASARSPEQQGGVV